MRAVLSTSTIPLAGSSIRSAQGISLVNPGQDDVGVRATLRPPGSVMPLVPQHVMRRTPIVGSDRMGRWGIASNSGSSVISAGEIVVNMRVR